MVITHILQKWKSTLYAVHTVSSFHLSGFYGISRMHKSDGKPLTLHQLTPCSRVFLRKLILGHLVQKETALMVTACSARSAPSSQRSKQEHLDCKKSAAFCRWYHALRNKRHYVSWGRTLLCSARRGDLSLWVKRRGCEIDNSHSSNAETTYPWSSVATSRYVLMECRFIKSRDNFTSTAWRLEKHLDILMCPQSGGCMVNRVTTYKYCHRQNLITDTATRKSTLGLNRLSECLQGHFWAFPRTRPQLGGRKRNTPLRKTSAPRTATWY